MFFRHWSIGRKLAAVLASILVLFMGSSASPSIRRANKTES